MLRQGQLILAEKGLGPFKVPTQTATKDFCLLLAQCKQWHKYMKGEHWKLQHKIYTMQHWTFTFSKVGIVVRLVSRSTSYHVPYILFVVKCVINDCSSDWLLLQAINGDSRITKNWTVAVTLRQMQLSPQSLAILQISTNQPKDNQSGWAVETATKSLETNLPRSVHNY